MTGYNPDFDWADANFGSGHMVVALEIDSAAVVAAVGVEIRNLWLCDQNFHIGNISAAGDSNLAYFSSFGWNFHLPADAGDARL